MQTFEWNSTAVTDDVSEVHTNITFTFTLRAFGRCFYPKRLTISYLSEEGETI